MVFCKFKYFPVKTNFWVLKFNTYSNFILPK